MIVIIKNLSILNYFKIMALSAQSTCEICCEVITNRRKQVNCLYCLPTHTACVTCVKRYLLDLAAQPSCMFCKALWNQEFLHQTFTKTWISTEWRRHHEDVLMSQIEAELPRLQPLALLEDELVTALALNRSLKLEKRELLRRTMENRANVNRLKIQIDLFDDIHDHTEQTTTIKRPCPQPECRGFLNFGICGMCKISICGTCRETKENDDHVCKPENVETTQMLQRQGKHCPHCGTLVMKDGGCDMMWDPNCQKAFYWSTLRPVKESTPIHNPEYFAYLRANNPESLDAVNAAYVANVANAANVAAGGCNRIEMRELMRRMRVHSDPDQHRIEVLATRCIELQERLNYPFNRVQRLRQEALVCYLRGLLTREQLGRRLHLLDKDGMTFDANTEIVRTYTQVSTDLINSIFPPGAPIPVRQPANIRESLAILQESERLATVIRQLAAIGELTNAAFARVAKQFKSKPCVIEAAFW